MKRRIILTALLVSLFGVLATCGTPALASDALTVNAAWVNNDMLHINVTDANGVNSAFALRLSDYVDNAENTEYIMVQAVDLAGNQSAVFEVRNPHYVAQTASPTSVILTTPPSEPPESASAVPGGNPFTPDGTGTVIDNAHSGDGKEFFTVGTEDGNVFYLIIDRQRTANNVYLLNQVTEEDLLSLAQRSGREIMPDSNVSAVPTPEQPTAPPTTEPEPPTAPPSGSNNSSTIIFVVVVALAAGGAAYYFKIVKGRKNAALYDDDEEDEPDYGYAEEPEADYEGEGDDD